jgi:HTH-type transcriptional regulator / antitoxin HigA
MAEENDFKPNWVSAPGDTMADILEERYLSLAEFAQRMGQTPEEASELLHGRATITIETARLLEVVLGSSAAFWMNRESQYREDVARLQREMQRTGGTEWLSEIPLKDMIKFGWIELISDSVDEVAACLRFFNVPDIGTWRETYRDVLEMAAFRTSHSFDSQPGAVAAWLRQGEIESISIDCNHYNAQQFQEVLPTIRSLTREKDPSFFLPELQKRCAECGVAVVIVRAPVGCRASGATRFLSPSKALLLLSFRYLSDDHFWFTFFHEAGHLLLHGKNALFLEGTNLESSKEENEANEFAARVLIPHEFRTALLELSANGRDVIRFARRVGVSPGIVVGQLQHLGRIRQNQLNNLKKRFEWDND